MAKGYRIPTQPVRIEMEVGRSRFVSTAGPAASVSDARAFIDNIRQEMVDASHHVYAFRVGYGNSVTEGMSDDGEPTGTSGPPILAILRGMDIGDIVVVVSRYFGGKKLGKGGLVRAYSDAARNALDLITITTKQETGTIEAQLPYTHYEPVRRLLHQYDGEVLQEAFAADVYLQAQIPVDHLACFLRDVQELTLGQVSFRRMQP